MFIILLQWMNGQMVGECSEDMPTNGDVHRSLALTNRRGEGALYTASSKFNHSWDSLVTVTILGCDPGDAFDASIIRGSKSNQRSDVDKQLTWNLDKSKMSWKHAI